MNEPTLLKLKVIVERAVRPVKASVPYKKRIREELLAHVTGVFEDELPRCGDETAALIQTERRFGDPLELARTLQESVPTPYRTAFYFERLIAPRVGESVLKRAARHGLMSFLAEACAFIAVCPLFLFFWKSQEFVFFVSLAVLISIGFGVMMFVSTLLINGIERELFGESVRSFARASVLIFVSCVVPVLLYLGLVSGLSLLASDDFRTFDLANLWKILSATAVFTGIVVWIANRSSTDKRHREEWEKLQID